MGFSSPFSVHRSPWGRWLRVLGLRRAFWVVFGGFLGIGLVAGWGRVGKIQAATCVTGPGVYCAAESCGVWYDPPNNCSTTNTHCDYYDPSQLHETAYDENGVHYPACDETNPSCSWDDDYGCQLNTRDGYTSCQYCYDMSSLCTCTDAYGTAVSCCYYCPDGSGCGNDGGGGGGSPTPTPSPPPGCTVGAPTKPALTSPTNGEVVSAGSNPMMVTLTWQAPSEWNSCNGTEKYNVYVEQDDTPGDGLVTDSSTLVSNCSGIETTSCSVSLMAGHKYDWTVMAMNESYGNTADPSWFDLEGEVSGTVYLDENNSCSTSQPSNFGGGMTASLRNTGYSGAVGSDGQFSIDAPAGSYTLDMTVPSGYICSTGPLGTGCGGGCPTQTGVTSPSTGNNFFFTQHRSAWWQVVGGDIYAGSTGGGTVIRSLIPSSVPASQRHLILSPDGVVIYRTGNLALDSGDVSAGGYKARAAYLGKRYDFDFWKAHIGVDLKPGNDWSVDSMSEPSYNTNKVYYWLTPTSGTAQLANDWSVASGEKYIVFIDGNLRLNHNITVANGGFLAFIVDGDITVSSNVTQVDGIYVADGRWVTEGVTSGYDNQLLVNGTVVAWTGIELHRDLGASNANKPAEKFSYRLDLMENMPLVMKDYLLRWKEVPAGTFE